MLLQQRLYVIVTKIEQDKPKVKKNQERAAGEPKCNLFETKTLIVPG